MGRQVSRFAWLASGIGGEGVVVKDNASEGPPKGVGFRGDEAILKQAAERVAFTGALAAADENAGRGTNVVVDSGVVTCCGWVAISTVEDLQFGYVATQEPVLGKCSLTLPILASFMAPGGLGKDWRYGGSVAV